MANRVANISDRGARRRTIGGVIWLALSVIALIVMMGKHTPHIYRLALAIPFALAGVGFFQARERTCVALGAVGKRETDDGAATCPMPSEHAGAVRAQMAKVGMESVLFAVVATAVAWII